MYGTSIGRRLNNKVVIRTAHHHHHHSGLVGDVAVPVSARQVVLSCAFLNLLLYGARRVIHKLTDLLALGALFAVISRETSKSGQLDRSEFVWRHVT